MAYRRCRRRGRHSSRDQAVTGGDRHRPLQSKEIGTSFTFDERAFKRAVEEQAQSAINEIAKNMTRDLSRLSNQYAGHPIDEIKPALKRVWEKDGGSLTDPELTQYAQAISDGTRIEFKPERVRL